MLRVRVTPAKQGLSGQTMKFSPFLLWWNKRGSPFFSAWRCINTKGLIFWLPLGHLYFVHECKLIPGLSASSSSPAFSPKGISKSSFSTLLSPFIPATSILSYPHAPSQTGLGLIKAFVFLAKGRGTDLAYLRSVTDHGQHWMGHFAA